MPLRLLILTYQSILVLSLSLRASQPPLFDPSLGLNFTTQLVQQSLSSVTDTIEAFFLRQLYPSNYQEVVRELDACQATYWTQVEGDVNAVCRDWGNFVFACMSGDPDAAVSQLLQDAFNSMSFPQCDFSVDLVGDMENLIAASMVQGYSYVGPWSQQLSQWALALAGGVSSAVLYTAPLGQVSNVLSDQLGISTQAINQFSADNTDLLVSWASLLIDLSSSNQLSQEDVVSVLDAKLTMMGDAGRIAREIVQGGSTLLSQVEPFLCLMVEPLWPMVGLRQPFD